MGTLREEMWLDENGHVVRYNLAFINHLVFSGDNGRVVGYDNAHGRHERHFMGKVKPYRFTSYDELTERFLKDVEEYRRQ